MEHIGSPYKSRSCDSISPYNDRYEITWKHNRRIFSCLRINPKIGNSDKFIVIAAVSGYKNTKLYALNEYSV